ncbi:MAG: DNA mismatch repair protein MutS [Clostridium sp.]|uniref:MutS-related protein n=1 Tax=Clostridium sp. TaxID=1506 RepID=UPI002A7488E0|nr:DNA mismatch repair protein MutS [Clostridium sp.]MCI6691097.1 DNA mismatch repair protein MutS [Clostridium sp.]MDY2631418.1 DNA mismatch repair protein MutS [Clostridium sp.]MDY4253219.1 DNA mismatch repair protein MutS [Clostridium sp.]
MKNKLLFYKSITLSSIVLVALTIYFTFKLGPHLGGRAYQIGIILFVVFIILASKFFDKSKKLTEIQYLIKYWPEAYDNKFDFEKIHKFYKEYSPSVLKEKDIYNIDDQTAHDLNIDDLLMKISICSSTPGEQMLYYLLRTPKLNSESVYKRNKTIETFINDKALRGSVQQILSNLGRQRKGDVFTLLNTTTTVSKAKSLLFNILALSSFIVLICFFILGSKYLPTFLGIFVTYMIISTRAAAEIEYELSSLQYLGNFIRAAKEISKLQNDSLKDYIDKINILLIPVSKIDNKTKYIYTSSELDIFIETLNGFFLTKIRSYYSIINIIKNNRQNLIELYALIGKLEAYISVASYRCRIANYCIPKFLDNKNKTLIVKDAVHPLLEDGIPNSIELKGKGVVLTGSNMSGKSTFMRTLATNILLSQCFSMSISREYTSSFFRIMSSLSLSDDVLSGASYYLEECNSVLRILNSLEEDVPAFCIIDEIFKGTNPIERISASKEILKYIMNKNAISIVATHDLELAENCSDKYLRYYFCEDIDEDEGLTFDFKLKEGICNTGNAIKLLDFLGYPKEIIVNSKKNIFKI